MICDYIGREETEMKTFNAPVLNVLKFDVEDIITVSGGESNENLLEEDRD